MYYDHGIDYDDEKYEYERDDPYYKETEIKHESIGYQYVTEYDEDGDEYTRIMFGVLEGQKLW